VSLLKKDLLFGLRQFDGPYHNAGFHPARPTKPITWDVARSTVGTNSWVARTAGAPNGSAQMVAIMIFQKNLGGVR
jgi:hypothetical protein